MFVSELNNYFISNLAVYVSHEQWIMSTRALRRLKGKQRGQEALDLGDLTSGDSREEQAACEEEQLDTANVSSPSGRNSRKANKNKAQKNFSNLYELIGDADNEAEEISADEEAEKPDGNKTSGMERNENGDFEKPDQKKEGVSTKSSSGDRVKKKKKKKKTKVTSEDRKGAVPDDNIDLLLENLEQTNGLSLQTEDCGGSDRKSVLHVEHRNLNPETELKRYFGARAVQGDQRPRQRNRQFHRTTWMTSPKDSWPRFSRPGISMTLLHSKDGIQYFTFEHSRDYQQVQFKFLDAVESMDPNNIVVKKKEKKEVDLCYALWCH